MRERLIISLVFGTLFALLPGGSLLIGSTASDLAFAELPPLLAGVVDQLVDTLDPDPAPPPDNDEGDEGCGKLFVAVTGDPQNGDGSQANPYRTITKAVDRARQIRSVCSGRVIIDVGPGTFSGSSIGSPTVETLPIVVDVPDITLRGSTELDADVRGLPTGTFGSATTLSLPAEDDTVSALLLVTPSDNGATRGDRVTVTGFVLDSALAGNTSTTMVLGTVDVAFDRVQGFIFAGNITKRAFAGVSTRAASGRVEANYISGNFLGAGITGGNNASPATITFTKNRVTENGETGLGFVGTGDTLYPFTPRVQSTVTDIFDTIVATATDNDLSGNSGAGLWIMNQTRQTLASSSHVSARITDNTLDKNTFGVIVHGGLVYRTIAFVPVPLPYSGTTDATFQDNVITNSKSAPALVTFTHPVAAVDPQQLLVPKNGLTYKYLQQSTFTISDSGELADAWIDHPVLDPVDCRMLCNELEINGVSEAPPIRSGLGPPFMSVCPQPILATCGLP
jgi:hypothetical protein